jgi:hypothetical protein
MGVNQYLIVASRNIKVKKSSSIAIPLFLLGLYRVVMGIIKLSLGVKVLHVPKHDQSLFNPAMVVLSLKIGLIEYVCLVLKVLQKCGTENSWMPYVWYKMCISAKMECQVNCSPSFSLELSLIDFNHGPFAL